MMRAESPCLTVEIVASSWVVCVKSGVEGIEVIRERCCAAACILDGLAGGGSSVYSCHVLETLPS